MFGINFNHCAQQQRVISEALENKLYRIYSFIQYVLIGSLAGVAIVNTIDKFINIPAYVDISWLSANGVSISTISILIGGLIGLSAARLFHLK